MSRVSLPAQIPTSFDTVRSSSTSSTYSSVFIDPRSKVNHTPNLFANANFTSNSLPIFQQSHQGHPSSTTQWTPWTAECSTAAPDALGKPLINNSLTLRQFITIINEANKPIKGKLDLISLDLHGKMTGMDHRIEFLENENEKKDEENSTLKLTIGNMQRSLNRIDSKERSLNVMVSGLPEGKLTVANEELDNDTQKIKCILRHTGNTHFDSEIIDNLNILSLGAEKTGYNRIIKISPTPYITEMHF